MSRPSCLKLSLIFGTILLLLCISWIKDISETVITPYLGSLVEMTEKSADDKVLENYMSSTNYRIAPPMTRSEVEPLMRRTKEVTLGKYSKKSLVISTCDWTTEI